MGRTYEKCPRCELNYLKEGELLCTLCRAVFADADDEEEFCPICGENVLQCGEDVCEACRVSLREMSFENES